MKKTIRLDEKLIRLAEIAGAKYNRSVASQLEYWASIGRQVDEDRIQPSERLKALGDFNATFLNQVQECNASGDFEKDLFMIHPFLFVKSKMGLGYIDKVYSDGTIVTGRLVNGNFVEETRD